MHRPPAIDRRELILTGLAATLAAVAAPSLVMAATPKLRVSNAKALGGIRRVMIGSFGMNFVTERKASQSIGGGFRSKGGTANVNVQTTLAGLRSADYQAAADAGYAAAIKALGAAGIEVADNKDLLASLLAKVRAQPGGDEDSFSEGNKSSVKMVRYGATPFGGFVPLDGWATMGGGFSGLRNMGALQAGLAATAHLKAYAKANNIAILGVLITVNPVKMTKEQGSEWRVPDAFGYGGLARTNSISTETGLSSNPFKTWLDVYPASGGTGQVSVGEEIGIGGGIGALADTTSGGMKALQGAANILSNPLFGGSGGSSKSANYTLNADAGAYVAGVGALSFDVAQTLAAALA